MQKYIEILESRIAPAGIVTVGYDAGTKTLTLTSVDDAATPGVDSVYVDLFQTGKDTYRVETFNSTFVGTAAGPTFQDIAGKVTSLKIVGAAGSDNYSVTNLTGLNDLDINGGAAGDTNNFTTTNLGVKKNVTLNTGADYTNFNFGGTTTIGGDVTSTHGANGGELYFYGVSTAIKGAVTVTGAANTDYLYLDSDTTTVGKGIKFTGAGGGDYLEVSSALSATIGKGATGNAIEFDPGAGGASMSIYSPLTNLKGNVVLKAADATFDGVTYIGGDLTSTSNSTGNSISIDGSIGAVKGGVTITGDAGSDSFTLDSVVGIIGKGITFTGALGNDTVTVNDGLSTVIGKNAAGNAIDFTGGDGTNSVTVSGVNVSLKGNVAYTGGADTDNLKLRSDSLKVDGETKFTGGGSYDNFDTSGNSQTFKKSVTVDLGAGGGEFSNSTNALTFGKDVTVTGADGTDVSFSGYSLTVKGNLSATGAAGNDTFSISENALSVKGNVSFTGGADSDSASIYGDGSIKGDVMLDLGAADDSGQDISVNGALGLVGGLSIGGKLTAISATTDTTLNGNSDSFALYNVQVKKDMSVSLGSADVNVNSSVDIENLIAFSKVAITTGAGADTVQIEQGAAGNLGSYQGPSFIDGDVTIKLGAGDDTLLIGKSSAATGTAPLGGFVNDSVVFAGLLTTDGEGGADTRNKFTDALVNTFVGPAPVAPANFETVL